MSQDDNYAIVETDPNSLPNHWSSIGELDDGRRVMEVFSKETQAERYKDRMYGMYESDAEVISLEDKNIEL